MADLGLSAALQKHLALAAQRHAAAGLDKRWGACDGIWFGDSNLGLHSKVGAKMGSHDVSPPGTGSSTPPPPSIACTYLQSPDALSSGEATPPQEKLVQHVTENLESSRARRLPLKPGLVEGPKLPWHVTLKPPPGLPPPSSMSTSSLPVAPPVQVASVPGPAAVITPPPTPPPSKGSVGHPHSCGEACKYIKRKTGCSQGADCPQCHLCFWRHRRALKSETADICSSAYSAGGKCASLEVTKPLAQESVGSVNHPDGCAAPCKYVKRKGGCRLGSSCPDCHLCHWRRTCREPIGLSEETSPGFSRNATARLEDLICLQLENSSSERQPAIFEAELGSTQSERQPTPSGGEDEAHVAQCEFDDEALRFIGPAPGLERQFLLSTQGSLLLGGRQSPR